MRLEIRAGVRDSGFADLDRPAHQKYWLQIALECSGPQILLLQGASDKGFGETARYRVAPRVRPRNAAVRRRTGLPRPTMHPAGSLRVLRLKPARAARR